eukprot:33024_1
MNHSQPGIAVKEKHDLMNYNCIIRFAISFVCIYLIYLGIDDRQNDKNDTLVANDFFIVSMWIIASFSMLPIAPWLVIPINSIMFVWMIEKQYGWNQIMINITNNIIKFIELIVTASKKMYFSIYHFLINALNFVINALRKLIPTIKDECIRLFFRTIPFFLESGCHPIL